MRLALYGLHRGTNTNPRMLRDRAPAAEDAGFDELWVGDHIALPGEPSSPAREPRLEALSTLTFLAAVTTRVRLVAGVIVVPQRHPVLLAKQLASLDHLSSGRLAIGVGLGYIEPELAAFQVRLADRAALADEYLDAVLALWRRADRFDGDRIRRTSTRSPRRYSSHILRSSSAATRGPRSREQAASVPGGSGGTSTSPRRSARSRRWRRSSKDVDVSRSVSGRRRT